LALNEIIKIGIGANHKRYQKLPFNPLEKYQHKPDKITNTEIRVFLKKILSG
jgi:hypothetical protein